MGKKSTDARQPSIQELQLLQTQDANLQSLTAVAEEQFDLSKEDRARYEEVFINADTPESQAAMADLQEQLTGTRPTGNITTETLLRDVLVGSTGKLQEATQQFVAQQQADFDSYEGELTGLSKEFSDTIGNINKDYQAELQTTKEKMGTIDQDILSREKGAAIGGISSAYQELRKQQTGDLARRGLTGSGAELNVLNQTYQAEARDKAGSLAQARMQSLGLSDQRRMQQMGISGQQAQYGANTAQQQYGTAAGVAGQLYGQQAGINQSAYGLNAANTQQGIGNLQAINAAGQGLYVGSGNYLGQAASSYGTGAQISGTSAYNQGSLNNSYEQMQLTSQGAAGAGIGSLVGTALGGGGLFSTGGIFG